MNTRTSSRLATQLQRDGLHCSRKHADVLAAARAPVPAGADIRRQGSRCIDPARRRPVVGRGISPAASIKVTRHNMLRPTSVTHETGHQVAHLLGWNAEVVPLVLKALRAEPGLAQLVGVLGVGVRPPMRSRSCTAATRRSPRCTTWSPTTCERPAHRSRRSTSRRLPAGAAGYRDVPRFGRGRGTTSPPRGPWSSAHGPAVGDAGGLERSRRNLRRSSEILLDRPLQCFGGRPLTASSIRVGCRRPPWNILLATGGPSLFTSPHWASREALRIVALSGLRIAVEPSRTTEHTTAFIRFTHTVSALGATSSAA